VKEIHLDAETRLLIALGFLLGRYSQNTSMDIKAANVMAELQRKLDIRIVNLQNFRVGTWINEIVGKEVFRQ